MLRFRIDEHKNGTFSVRVKVRRFGPWLWPYICHVYQDPRSNRWTRISNYSFLRFVSKEIAAQYINEFLNVLESENARIANRAVVRTFEVRIEAHQPKPLTPTQTPTLMRKLENILWALVAILTGFALWSLYGALSGLPWPFEFNFFGAAVLPAMNVRLRNLSERYLNNAWISRPRFRRKIVRPSVDLMRTIADLQDSAINEPYRSSVRDTYFAFMAETQAQFYALVSVGYEFHRWNAGGQPYANSADMIEDVRANRRLFYFPTDNGFGDNPDFHYLLAPSMFCDSDGNRMLVNDVFRCVHDMFGHAMYGYSFGPVGEFNAWRAHSHLFTDQAQAALAAETLYQNAWVNYGPHLRRSDGTFPTSGDPDFIPLSERPYSAQKQHVPEFIPTHLR